MDMAHVGLYNSEERVEGGGAEDEGLRGGDVRQGCHHPLRSNSWRGSGSPRPTRALGHTLDTGIRASPIVEVF